MHQLTDLMIDFDPAVVARVPNCIPSTNVTRALAWGLAWSECPPLAEVAEGRRWRAIQS